MIAHFRPRTQTPRRRPGRVLPAALALLLTTACGDNPTAQQKVLCGGDFGVGLRVEGRSAPVEVCVKDADVSALLTSLSHYDIAAQMQAGDAVYQIRMVFAKRSDFPVTLRVVSDLADTSTDPGTVWLHYQEIPTGGDPVESVAASGGKFRLSYSDDKVAVGYCDDVSFQMQDVTTGEPAGARRIVHGEFSVSNKGSAPTTTALR